MTVDTTTEDDFWLQTVRIKNKEDNQKSCFRFWLVQINFTGLKKKGMIIEWCLQYEFNFQMVTGWLLKQNPAETIILNT